MTEILTSAQMRAIERAAIDSGVVTGLSLMERAGEGVLSAIFEEWPELADAPQRATVLCGPGNNGGDGFVVARLLARFGWQVSVILLGDAQRLPPDAQVNHDRWCAAGGAVFAWQGLVASTAHGHLLASDIVVDALFGTGLTRPLGEVHNALWRLFDMDNGRVHRLVSIDIPSGLCADSGRLLGLEGFAARALAHGATPFALAASLTVTFHGMKLGHILADGPACCGKVVVKDIGLPNSHAFGAALARRVLAPAAQELQKNAGHKYSHGHALVLTGGMGRTGAARLAARGALRVGAGLVSLGVPGAALIEVAAQVTALMLARIDSDEDLASALQDQRFNAICLGPGLGTTDDKAVLVACAIQSARPTVLDADALTLLARLPALGEGLHDQCILTPHFGEFARLFPDIADQLVQSPETGPSFSKVDAVRAAARRAGCVVLLKGPDTVVATPSGICHINAAVYDSAAPWLATAGAGDVLAGCITGLLARGFSPLKAASTAAWLHAECARRFGPGLIAEDLPETLPEVLAELPVQA